VAKEILNIREGNAGADPVHGCDVPEVVDGEIPQLGLRQGPEVAAPPLRPRAAELLPV
jgi:hypothetical protein